MNKQEIIQEISKDKIVEEIVYNIGSKGDEDLKDLIQDIYINLLEKEDSLIETLYNTNQLKYFIIRMVVNNIHSKNSPYYTKYKKDKINKVKGEVQEILLKYKTIKSMHDFRITEGKDKINIIFDIEVNAYEVNTPDKEEELKGKLESDIKKLNPLYNCVITIDKYF